VTPSRQTLGFFNQDLGMEYNHERAVTDGVNVGYDPYRIRTEMTEQGGPVKAYQTFGTELNKLLEELNEVLAA
jgi:type I site-specific restriction endonuclease